jgi:hypothetical protein
VSNAARCGRMYGASAFLLSFSQCLGRELGTPHHEEQR